MLDRFLEADMVALENLLAVDSDDELLDVYVDVRLQKAQVLELTVKEGRRTKRRSAPQSYKTRMAKDETKTAYDSTWF